MYPNNGGYGYPANNNNYNEFNQAAYQSYVDPQAYGNYNYQNTESGPQQNYTQPKWQSRPKSFPKRSTQQRFAPKQGGRGHPSPANYNQSGSVYPMHGGNQYSQGNQFSQSNQYNPSNQYSQGNQYNPSHQYSEGNEQSYHRQQAPQPVQYRHNPHRPQPAHVPARGHPQQHGYGAPGQYRGQSGPPRGRGAQGGFGSRGSAHAPLHSMPQQPALNALLSASPLNALASLGPLAPAVLNNMDTQQLVNLLLTPTQNIVAALPSQSFARHGANVGRGRGRAQPGAHKVIPSKKFAPAARGIASGPPQRPVTGRQHNGPAPVPKTKDKPDSFADNINKTFIASLLKPDTAYLTASYEQLDAAELLDPSTVHAEVVQSIIARTNYESATVREVVALLARDYSVPFIHAYRRDVIGSKSLSDLREIERFWREGHNLAKYKQYILHAFFAKGKLTADLKNKIAAATNFAEVADYYIPIKLESNPRTAPIKVVGLDKLTAKLIDQTPFDTPNMNLHAFAMSFIKPEQGYPDYPSVMKAAVQLAAEQICGEHAVRAYIRLHFTREARVKCFKSNKVANVEKQGKDQDFIKRAHKFRDYFSLNEPIAAMSNQRVLTMLKGEREGYLRTEIEFPHDVIAYLKSRYLKDAASDYALYITNAVEQAWRQYLVPIFAAEVRAQAAARASEPLLPVIYRGVQQLLLQPPVKGAVMGIDPGYKSGCRVAVVNERGVLQSTTLIYPHAPVSQVGPAKEALLAFYRQHGVVAVAIAQGFGARETERFLANLNAEHKMHVQFVILNELAAAGYAASDLGREEFPTTELQMRAAISVARRLQDPLNELVKVDVESIGYHALQQDVVGVRAVLEAAVTDAVNTARLDLNTCSLHQLRRVSGLTDALAREIVACRALSPFTSRQQLLAVPQVTAEVFERCAGFVRIAIDVATNALDCTRIHPAEYSLAEQLLQAINETADSVRTSEGRAAIKAKLSAKELTTDYLLALGAPNRAETVRHVVECLTDPLHDPRDLMPRPALKTDVPRMTDLTIGKVVEGVVTNITNFGIFMDLGMKQTGFVHKSEVSNNVSDTPASVASVGDVLRARVASLDFQRDRIVLSLRNVPDEADTAHHASNVPDTVAENNTNVAQTSTTHTVTQLNIRVERGVDTSTVPVAEVSNTSHEDEHLPLDTSDVAFDLNDDQPYEGEGEGDEYEQMQGEEYAHDDEEQYAALGEHEGEEYAHDNEGPYESEEHLHERAMDGAEDDVAAVGEYHGNEHEYHEEQ